MTGLIIFFLLVNCILFSAMLQLGSAMALVHAVCIWILIDDLISRLEKGE